MRAQFSFHNVQLALRQKDQNYTHAFSCFCVLWCRVEISMRNFNIFLYLSVCLSVVCVCVCLSISPVQQCGHKCSALQAAIWQKHSLVQFLSLSPLNHLILSFTVQMNILDFRVFLFFDMGFFFFSVV